jgi:hypothetical protein
VHGIQLIEELALELLPARRRVVASQAFLDRVAQLRQRLQSERLGELFINGNGLRRLDRFRGDLEFRRLAGERLGRIGLGEGHVDLARLAGRHAHQLLLETRDELLGADRHRDVVAGTAREYFAVDAADEVDDHAVAVFDLGALAFRRIRLVLIGDLLQRLVYLGVADLRDEPLELDRAEVRERDRRQHLERKSIGQIGLPADDAIDLGLLVRDRDLRLAREPEPALLDDLRVHLADDGVDRLRHHRSAIDLAQMRHRHLAGTEARQPDPVLQIVQPPRHAGFEIGGRNGHLEFALETVGDGFCDLHDPRTLRPKAAHCG